MKRFCRMVVIVVASLLLTTCTLPAQSVFNPAISVIPRFLLETHDRTDPSERRAWSRPDFTLEEFEIALQANLNPYARADIFLAKTGFGEEPVEIEEAYATFLRGLPLDMNVRIGKYLAEFGKLNSQHPHAWPFLTKPLVLQRFLGDEGINDLGLSVSFLLPTGDEIYTRFSVDVLRGNSVRVVDPASGEMTGGAGLADTSGGVIPYSNSARLMTFLPLGENSDLEVGISGLTGIHDPYEHHRFWYGSVDAKFKWRPDSYRSLTIAGEFLLNSRRVSVRDVVGAVVGSANPRSRGAYLYADYQFERIYSLGARFDYAQTPYSSDQEAVGFAVFAGFYPVEETTAFRLQYQHTSIDEPSYGLAGVNMIALQFIFSMGPHKAHPF